MSIVAADAKLPILVRGGSSPTEHNCVIHCTSELIATPLLSALKTREALASAS